MNDIAIIGSGPAGLSCALYALRGGRKTVIFEKDLSGGQLLSAGRIENYPGGNYSSGEELAKIITDQVINAGGDIIKGDARIEKSAPEEKIISCGGAEYKTRTVVIASGAAYRKLGIPEEAQFTGRGISYCSLCDGALYSGADVAVAGGGSSALSEALELSEICSNVYIIQNLPYLTGEKILQDRCRERKNIKVLTECEICGIMIPPDWKSEISDGCPVSLTVSRSAQPDASSPEFRGVYIKKSDSGIFELEVSGLFVAIGRRPDTEIFSEYVELDEQGYIQTDENCMASEYGIFAVGDCRRKSVRQIATACADGILSATLAGKYIERLTLQNERHIFT